jgi:dihydroflavonol-4-reductase
MPAENRLVLVTGANGFIGSHIVKQLLESGYSVRGTVRNLGNAAKLEHITSLDGASERLELVEAHLLDASVWKNVVHGCSSVMHVASPYILNVKNPQKELVDPAVEGTINVLQASLAENVESFILTSSAAAMFDHVPNHVVNEDDWNEDSSLTRNPYFFSKYCAEKAAWKLYEDAVASGSKTRMVVINPIAVLGPSLNSTIGESMKTFIDAYNGKLPAIPKLSAGVVDVRDVATAHIRAMEMNDATGRFLLGAESVQIKDLMGWIRERYPDNHHIPKIQLNATLTWLGSWVLGGMGRYLRDNTGLKLAIDNSKSIKVLGIKYISAKDSLIAGIEAARLFNVIH